jgi:hypothetical protein
MAGDRVKTTAPTRGQTMKAKEKHMKTRTLLAAGVIIAALTAVPVAQAAIITFTAEDFTHINKLSTEGTLIEARNFGSGTVNVTVFGITFVAAGASGDHLTVQNGLTYSHSAMYDTTLHGTLTASGLSETDGNALFDTLVYGGGVGSSRVTLSGLTVGAEYRFQILAVDDRIDYPQDTSIEAKEVFPGTNTTGPRDYSRNHVQLLTGTLTADAATQSFIVTTSWDDNVIFSAYQLRQIPEPASLGMLGVAATALLLRRRFRR